MEWEWGNGDSPTSTLQGPRSPPNPALPGPSCQQFAHGPRQPAPELCPVAAPGQECGGYEDEKAWLDAVLSALASPELVEAIESPNGCLHFLVQHTP